MTEKTQSVPLLFRGGWLPDIPDQRDLMLEVKPEAALPPVVDLSPDCPPVYDQGNLGSCTANAIAGALEYDRKRQGLDIWVPSRLQIYYNERVMEDSVDSDSGAFIRDGIKSVNSFGAGREELWPYDVTKFADIPSPAAVADGAKHLSVKYLRIDNTVLGNMRWCLAVYKRPFVIGVSVYSSFMDAVNGDIPQPAKNEDMIGGHAILIVGYDNTKQRFTFRNSWGPDWGRNGYGTFPYAYLSDPNLSDDAWTITVVT
jgi:C1A family cysteine protease